jgi:hypothetical protein
VLEYYNSLSSRAGAEPAADKDWMSINDFISAEHGPSCFYEIMMVIDSPLTDEEISRASGCLGYALREVLAGEDLSEPEVTAFPRSVQLAYHYDSTKSRRDDPDYLSAFEKAARYIEEGTPVRRTNRAGAGTKGTRLVEGIGTRKITFYLR